MTIPSNLNSSIAFPNGDSGLVQAGLAAVTSAAGTSASAGTTAAIASTAAAVLPVVAVGAAVVGLACLAAYLLDD
jgi:hypothetical protein